MVKTTTIVLISLKVPLRMSAEKSTAKNKNSAPRFPCTTICTFLIETTPFLAVWGEFGQTFYQVEQSIVGGLLGGCMVCCST
jgi:hypothetical protein